MTSYINGTVEVCHQPFDGSGNFNRLMNWVADATAGTKIKSDRHDTEDNNFASGLSNVICKDGQTAVTADIPLNGKKLVNVGAPVNPTDAATKGYADAIRAFSTAISLTGASPQSRIAFPVADIGFGAREAGAPAGQPSRWVWNDKADLSGSDVAVLTDTGVLTANSAMSTPTSYVGTVDGSSVGGGLWLRKRASGFSEGIYFSDGAGGIRGTFGADTANQLYFRVGDNTTNDITFGTTGDITATGQVTANQNFESSTVNAVLGTTGAGTVHLRPNGVSSGTGATFVQSNGNLNAAGQVTSATGIFASSAANAILSSATAGTIILRPNGAGSATGQVVVTTNELTVPVGSVLRAGNGRIGKAGAAGGYGAQLHNWFYNAGPVQCWVDGTNLGNVTVSSDYRIKKDVVPLASTWEQVKALRPISYTQADFTPPAQAAADDAKQAEGEVETEEVPASMFPADDIERWGFIAHELQETLLPTAANGVKDSEDEVQSLNLAPILAATVKALQEAMLRIEALEAAA